MTLEKRVTDLEKDNKELWKRLDIIEASDAKWGRLIDEQLSGHAEVMLGNMTQMRQFLKDLQEHFKSHSLDKKEKFNPNRRTNRYNKYIS